MVESSDTPGGKSGPSAISFGGGTSERGARSRLSKAHTDLLRRAELVGRIEACWQLRDEAAEVDELRAVEFIHERMVGHEIKVWLLEKFGG